MNPESTFSSNDRIERENSEWVQPLQDLGVPKEQWAAVVRALTKVGIGHDRLIEQASAWPSLVEKGKPFPGFPQGKEDTIASLLLGERKLDDPS